MVNVQDMNVDEIQRDDMLEAIFDKQRELLEKYKEIEYKNLPCVVPIKLPVDINTHQGQHVVKMRIWWAMTELAEAADCLKNKPWKQTMMETDEAHLREELVDALHFFIEACILIGFEPQDLFTYYLKKAMVNEFRQRSKY